MVEPCLGIRQIDDIVEDFVLFITKLSCSCFQNGTRWLVVGLVLSAVARSFQATFGVG